MIMSSNLLELLPLAKKLSEANKAILEREAVLRQLSLLQNVANSFEHFSKLFQIDIKILPSMSSETLLVKLRNTSDTFNFEPQFWSLMTCFSEGKIAHWSFAETFQVGDTEHFSANFLPAFNSNVVNEITIRLVFSIKWNKLNYTKTFLIQSFPVDILCFLSAGRRVSSPQKPYLRATTKTGGSYLTCCKFSVSTDDKFRALFLENVLLKNVDLSRGFDLVTAARMFQTTGEIVAYYYEQKLTVAVEDNFLCFRCSNPRVLYCIKAACYTRILSLCKSTAVKIKCAQNTTEVAQKLYEINLNIQALSTTSDFDFTQLLGFYHSLREQSDSLVVFTA